LGYCKRRGGALIAKLVDSAVANAKERGGIDIDNLYVKNVLVDDGPILKRFLPRSMGRADKILKKMSHVTVVLDEAR
jgi:large subunit ribosomal protein L22